MAAEDPGEEAGGSGAPVQMHPSHRGTVRRKKEKVRPPALAETNMLDDDGNLLEEAG